MKIAESAAQIYPDSINLVSMDNSLDTAADTYQRFVEFVSGAVPSAGLYEHPLAKTSNEAMEARYRASGKRVPGAKALLVRLDLKDEANIFAVVVLPGFHRLDSKMLKRVLKEHMPGVRGFRFATAEEMAQVAPGIEPGKMPPFGRPFFPGVTYTFIDKSLLDYDTIGFNAAHFERSYIMQTTDYLDLVTHDGIISCSQS